MIDFDIFIFPILVGLSYRILPLYALESMATNFVVGELHPTFTFSLSGHEKEGGMIQKFLRK